MKHALVLTALLTPAAPAAAQAHPDATIPAPPAAWNGAGAAPFPDAAAAPLANSGGG